MPIYAYCCEACGERFEELISADAPAPACPRCGHDRAKRLLSAQAAPFDLVRPPGAMRKQERKNAQLHARTKAEFKARRRRAREARSGDGGG